MLGKKYHIAAIGAILVMFALVHALIFRGLSPHVVLEELCYIPIFWGALRFGLKGAILVYLFASLSYLPFFFRRWSLTNLDIVIRDHGAGMDGETLENIFMPFYTSKKGGTGLGMSIAKKIIDSHHGRLTVSSRSGRGTVVTVELPRFTPIDRKR